MDREKLIELVNVSAGYHDEVVLHGVNLQVFKDDFIGVIGPNGGGKTTLLKVMLGLIKPFSGQVIMQADGNCPPRQLIGYLPQFSQIDKKFPIGVEEVVLSGLLHAGRVISRHGPKERQRAHEIMDRFGVLQLAKKNIGELSGGQMQRVFLCRAIISSPRLLVLDEPNTFVDNRFESDFFAQLKSLNEEMAIVMVSHDVGTISYYVKTIACVNHELHFHPSNIITERQLAGYNCPLQIITHGDVPHTVLKKH